MKDKANLLDILAINKFSIRIKNYQSYILYKQFFTMKLILLTSLILFLSGTSYKGKGIHKDDVSANVVGAIRYNSIPKFRLSPYFIIVYGGPIFKDNISDPLSHGVTHIDLRNQMHLYSKLSKQQRAYGIYGLSYIDPKFMEVYGKSFLPAWKYSIQKYPSCFVGKDRQLVIFNPWNNDLQQSFFKYYDWLGRKEGFKGKEFDYVWFDFEASNTKPEEIVKLQCPEIFTGKNRYLLSLSKEQFVDKYFEEMSRLYDSCFTYISENVCAPTFRYRTVYKENAVKYYPYSNEAFTKVNKNNLLYGDAYINKLVKKRSHSYEYTSLYKHSTVLSPNVYAPVNYPYYPLTDYVLSVINLTELNLLNSDKSVVPFVWLRRNHPVDNCRSQPPIKALPTIETHEAMALGPMVLMSGAKGLHLWDHYNEAVCNKQWIDHSIYEYFFRGLEQFSRYQRFFNGEQYYFRRESSFEYILDKTPMWRGVYNNGVILITAYNPWAKNDETTSFSLQLGRQKIPILIEGKNVSYKVIKNYSLSELKKDQSLYIFQARK